MNTCFMGSQASARSSRSGIWATNTVGASGELGYSEAVLEQALDWEPGELGTKQNSCKVQITMWGGGGEQN